MGRQRQILWIALAVIVVALLLRACGAHENRYETIAHQLTQAIQDNDVPAIQKLENVETAADATRGRIGRASDAFAPLGKIHRVREVQSSDTTPRVHEFDVTFDHGKVHEKIQFDPQDKVYRFHYDQPTTS
jgi:hypothetical protein